MGQIQLNKYYCKSKSNAMYCRIYSMFLSNTKWAFQTYTYRTQNANATDNYILLCKPFPGLYSRSECYGVNDAFRNPKRLFNLKHNNGLFLCCQQPLKGDCLSLHLSWAEERQLSFKAQRKGYLMAHFV